MMLILACAKKLVFFDRAARSGDYDIRNRVKGMDLEGKTLGLLGLGKIGHMVAKKAIDGFGMKVLGYDPFLPAERWDPEVQRCETMEEIFSGSDIVSIHMPSTPETRNSVDARLIGMMKPTAYLINAARGDLIREEDLIEALKNNAIAGAGLDVYPAEPPSPDDPLFQLPNVTVTGELNGVMVGDEVILNMTATTMGNKSEVGTYEVVITSWELGGLHAANYKVYEPVYSLIVKISTNAITDKVTGSYITTPGGFSSNITVSFSEVYDTVNESNFFTKLFGQKATVEVIEVKENGLPTVLAQKVKFYARIPDEYLNSQNLVVEGLGNLAGVTDFTREGDFITFYADSSGEIVFYTNDFPYWVIIAIGAVVIIILGIVIILIAAPMRRRKHVNAGARKIYKWSENRGSLEESYMRELKAQREAKKRKWRL